MGYLNSMRPEDLTVNELIERQRPVLIDDPGHWTHGKYRASKREGDKGTWVYGDTEQEAIEKLEAVK